MNVIISNKYQSLLANLDIDVIKSINGEFDVEEIVSNFTNFFFNKMPNLQTFAFKKMERFYRFSPGWQFIDYRNIQIAIQALSQSTRNWRCRHHQNVRW